MASTGYRAHPDRFLPPDPRVEEPYRFTPQMGLRVAILGVLALGVFAVLFLRLWALQVLSGPRYLVAAQNNQIRSIEQEAPRGSILDAKGRILVTNVAGTKVLLWPVDLPKGEGRDTELRRLAAILRIPFAEVVKQIEEHGDDPLTPITLARGVHKDQVAYLWEHRSEFPGVTVADTYFRRYKAEALAAHVLGYVGPISKEQLRRQQERDLNDRVGQAGVEARYDEYLRGEDGTAEIRVDSRGRPQSGLLLTEPPKSGQTLRLTIDIALQRASERAIRYGIELAHRDDQWAANGGAIVALDPRNGEVLALASNPTYKPGIWVGSGDPKRLAPLLDAKAAAEANYPGVNRATAGLYPPGSTFKPVTALAAMQEGLLSPHETLECTPEYVVRGETGADQVFKNWAYMNEGMNLRTALAASCDTYFYRLGHYFYGLPPNRGHPHQAWASRFGFGESTGIDLAPDEAGLLPTPEWRKATFTKERYPKTWEIDSLWKPGDSIQLAIGQKDLLVTPLQMARFYALIANGGKLVTPHIAKDVEIPGDERSAPRVIQTFAPLPAQSAGVDPDALAAVRDGLYAATHEPYGTSTGVFSSFPVDVCGKTGTAEKIVNLKGYHGLMDQSWWVGYAPCDNPTIVVAALIENGGHGGTAAAPAALKVFEHYFHRRATYVAPEPSD